MPILKSRNRNTAILQTPGLVIETRPASLAGASEFLRDVYVKDNVMTNRQALILVNLYSGEMDVSSGSVSRPRPRKYASISRIADARNRARRAEYQKLRDHRKSAKKQVVRQ